MPNVKSVAVAITTMSLFARSGPRPKSNHLTRTAHYPLYLQHVFGNTATDPTPSPKDPMDTHPTTALH
ncbi:hypothetical protein P171DRAFT_219221 [Karstenula rhodostoma CBS 690.94]|uniref:Uncharacterized protein n=1 Tax=Karstenula rhodostoma CBS 690.94 TaxID=1392251 RepID=A0A9P4PR91_9PLEO|nr:hypothetical protein P171DRAFT_219221 [Karstenula rhodostoma CBS 690.94]